jgi:hypothetical protein
LQKAPHRVGCWMYTTENIMNSTSRQVDDCMGHTRVLTSDITVQLSGDMYM